MGSPLLNVFTPFILSESRWLSYAFFLFANFIVRYLFPTITRDCVFRFFHDDLKCSPDVAEILTNFTTVDLDKVGSEDTAEIDGFLSNKGITTKNHLGSGFPTSPLLSYLANNKMFNELKVLADTNNMVMTVYVDDVIFSSTEPISRIFRENVLKTIEGYYYLVSRGKTRLYKKAKSKLVTGVIITPDHRLVVKNSLRRKTLQELRRLKSKNHEKTDKKQIQGLVNSARYIDGNVFSSIHDYAYAKDEQDNNIEN